MQKKILIVDDEPAVLEYIKIVIDEELREYEADYVSNIEDALEKVKSGEYGAILSDFYLQRGNVIPLYKLNQSHEKIPFALLSGEFPDYIRGWFLDQNVSRSEVSDLTIISKPFDIDELGAWIKSALHPLRRTNPDNF